MIIGEAVAVADSPEAVDHSAAADLRGAGDMNISKQTYQRISQAITIAETRTAGEISCVIAPDVGDYAETPIVWAALLALVVPLAIVLSGFDPSNLLEQIRGWSAAHGVPAATAARTGIMAYAALQACVFAVIAAIMSLPAVRRSMTSGSVKAESVHRAALQHFTSHGLDQTRDRTGVLLFVALAEHRAEVIADEGIYSKVENSVWDEVNDLLLAGMKKNDVALAFEAAIARTGDILAEHVPPLSDNPNETPDRLEIYTRKTSK
jgi:putative membrane protein